MGWCCSTFHSKATENSVCNFIVFYNRQYFFTLRLTLAEKVGLVIRSDLGNQGEPDF